MKIRIKSNSLRYRLTRSEVERFAQEGVIKEKIQIGDEALTYILQRTAENEMSASFHNNIITLLMPKKWQMNGHVPTALVLMPPITICIY
jgi:arabinogalactan endo-1,4-beta-galactosidase